MSLTLARKGLAIAVAVGLVTAGAATTVSYAAGSTSSNVSACANKKGQLGLLSKKKKCAKGYKKVSIAKQGARGATGATGKQGVAGKPGAAGPGAVKLLLDTSDSGIAPAVTVGSFSYRLGCDVNGNAADATVLVKPAGGVTGRINTAFTFSKDDPNAVTLRHYRATFTNETSFHASSTTGAIYTYVDSMRVTGSDGTVQLLSVQIIADASPQPTGNRCFIAGGVIPTS